MKVAIVHDYLHQFGGGEKVVEKWLEMYPKADVYTGFYIPEKFAGSKHFKKAYKENRIHTSFSQKILGTIKKVKKFKLFFWLHPLTMSFVRVEGYDLVLVSSVYSAKNAKFVNNNRIIHYCHSPTRFLHGLVTEVDHSKLPVYQRLAIPFFKFWLKRLDLKAVKNLSKLGTIWIANSKFIRGVIQKVYKTEAQVIYPPIEIDNFLQIERKETDKVDSFYLCHGRISYHKRIDLAIEACLRSGKKLKIGGEASTKKEMKRLENIVENQVSQNPAKEGLVEFLGRTTDDQYKNLLSEAKAFLFPGEEDFGISPVEVLASGCPVIAYKSGGALEYVEEGLNGVFFENQNIGNLYDAMVRFEDQVEKFSSKKIKKTSQKFSEQEFVNAFRNLEK